MTAFVMMPIFNQVQQYYSEHNVDLSNQASMHAFLDDGLGAYRQYLAKYAEPELVEFFGELQDAQLREHPPGVESPRPHRDVESDYVEQAPLLVLLPAYALSELKSAFKIGFYIYLPFLVVDMLISNILLALGMMMMSPVTIALPIKLILFVLLDGWEKLVKGLVLQYIDLAK
ncbi:Flagellar biosynthetic protein fliP precursor [Pandoraea pulmonicola]|nr:Flagellar biosynthetic protein fliP precursor [Pandoraea pulmonicola]